MPGARMKTEGRIGPAVWGLLVLLAVPVIAGAFWFDARLGLIALEMLPVIGGGLALYETIRKP